MRELEPSAELHAFTASSPGTDTDELPLARAVADRLGVTIHPVPLQAADLLTDLDDMARANDQPVEAASQYAQFAVMRQASRDGVTVLLDGQGADETWGGYEKYVSMDIADSVVTGRLGAAGGKIRDRRDVTGLRPALDARRVLPLALPGPARSAAVGLRSTFGTSWIGRVPTRVPVVRSSGWRHHPHPVRAPGGGGGTPRCHPGDPPPPPPVRGPELDDMVPWVRLPYLDHRLVEDAFRHPTNTKLLDGWTKMPIRHLLRRLRALRHPRSVRDKKAYMPPQAEWLGSDGMRRRVADSWRSMYDAGLVSTPEPGTGVVERWRVLSLVAWADAFGLRLG